MFFTNEVRSDVYVVYELKRCWSPDRLRLARIWMKATKCHKTADDRQIWISVESFERISQPASVIRYEIVVLD